MAYGPTWRLAEFIAGLQYGQVPEEVRGKLFTLFLDYLRVASLGERMEWSGWARGLVGKLGNSGSSYVLYSDARYDPVRAAFLNTTYAGSIDSDDTHVGAMLHPGAIVFSAALAIGQERHASGPEVMAAVAAGYETMIRLGLSIQPAHFQRGFQSTATCGGFGAAAAAARLLFPENERIRRVAETLGLVASFSSGLTQFYHSGSTVKRIHAAHAAGAGVYAALLAEAGFSGPTDILEGKDGFARAYADGANFDLLLEGLGRDYKVLEVTIKAHSCSARVQAAVEGTLDLCGRHSVLPGHIAEIEVGIPQIIAGRLTISNPKDVQAAQMSAPFSVALASARAEQAAPGFTLTIDDYEAGLADPVVVGLLGRIKCVVDPEVEAATTAESVPAKITLRLASGREHSVFVGAPKGSPSRPYTLDDHVARFRHEVGRRLSPAACDRLIKTLKQVEALADVASLGPELAIRGQRS